jgi:hypothetical protein
VKGGFRQSNPLNSAIQNPSKRVAGFEQANLMLDEPPLIVRMRGFVGLPPSASFARFASFSYR